VQILELGAKLIVALNMTDWRRQTASRSTWGSEQRASSKHCQNDCQPQPGITELKDAILIAWIKRKDKMATKALTAEQKSSL
jgi:Fe2+ transport system protein B